MHIGCIGKSAVCDVQVDILINCWHAARCVTTPTIGSRGPSILYGRAGRLNDMIKRQEESGRWLEFSNW